MRTLSIDEKKETIDDPVQEDSNRNPYESSVQIQKKTTVVLKKFNQRPTVSNMMKA